MKAFIYQWVNTENQMKYIGSHIGDENDGYIGSGKYFRNAYDLNPSIFKREILGVITITDYSQIKKLEESYLNKVDAANNPLYYNITNKYYGGDTFSNRSRSDQLKSIEKSMAGMKKHMSDNPEFWSEVYDKMSKTKRLKSKIIYQFDVKGNFIKNYTCIEEAYEDLKISKGNIHSALNGSRNIAGGFRWSYSNKPNDIIKNKTGRPIGSKNSSKIKRKHVNITTVQVLQKSLDGSLIKIWDSAKDAAEELSLSKGMIQHFINGRSSKDNYGGFVWVKGNKVNKIIYKD